MPTPPAPPAAETPDDIGGRKRGGARFPVTAQDIGLERRSAEELLLALKSAVNVVDAVRDGLVVLDRELRVSSANRAFLQAFGLELNGILGRRLGDLGRPELATAALTRMLQQLATQGVSDFQAEQTDAAGGNRSFLLNGHPIDGTDLCLLAFQDVTQIQSARIAQRKVEDDVRAYQERVKRMSFEAVLTEERERRRIAIGLHDRMGQTLALAQIKLTSVRADLSGEARTGVDGAVELLEQAITDARELIFELSPPILYDLGLKDALDWLAEDLQKKHGIHVEVTDDGANKPLDDTAKAVVFRAVRELLMNVLKHAQSATAKVCLRRDDGQYLIDVQDRGLGFDLGKDFPTRQGFGLLSLREQIDGLGGDLTLESSPGHGTLASVRVPLQASTPPAEASAGATADLERR